MLLQLQLQLLPFQLMSSATGASETHAQKLLLCTDRYSAIWIVLFAVSFDHVEGCGHCYL